MEVAARAPALPDRDGGCGEQAGREHLTGVVGVLGGADGERAARRRRGEIEDDGVDEGKHPPAEDLTAGEPGPQRLSPRRGRAVRGRGDESGHGVSEKGRWPWSRAANSFTANFTAR